MSKNQKGTGNSCFKTLFNNHLYFFKPETVSAQIIKTIATFTFIE